MALMRVGRDRSRPVLVGAMLTVEVEAVGRRVRRAPGKPSAVIRPLARPERKGALSTSETCPSRAVQVVSLAAMQARIGLRAIRRSPAHPRPVIEAAVDVGCWPGSSGRDTTPLPGVLSAGQTGSSSPTHADAYGYDTETQRRKAVSGRAARRELAGDMEVCSGLPLERVSKA